jgi:hypothetical protein
VRVSLRHRVGNGQVATFVRADPNWYVRRALRRWTRRSYGITAGIAATLALAACGGGTRQDASEPSGNFTVQVPTATFPPSQRLAQQTHLVISVRNAGTKTIPDVAVTICNVTCAYPAPPGAGTNAAAFAQDLNQANLASPSRPIWIVDRNPGPCDFSCKAGGPGGAATAYSNTWALGQLRPGATATFQWAVTAVKPGRHVVAWQVAAGLNGKAKAVLGDGSQPHGRFTVMIHSRPAQSFVTDSGKVVTKQ